MITDVTTYYLEMTDPKDLRPSLCAYPALSIEQPPIPSPELNKFLYTTVGEDWLWTDRLPWTGQEWQEWVNCPELKTWVAYASGTPAGYFELETHPDGSAEIASFGLLPSFIGRGLGGHFLTIAVQNAWQMGATRVWLHTCTLDHPNALRNYSDRGFRVFRESTVPQDVPEDSSGP